MILPKWVLGVVSTLVTALICAGFAWGWSINAEFSSTKTLVDSHHESCIKFESDVGTAFQALDKRLDRIENKIDRIGSHR